MSKKAEKNLTPEKRLQQAEVPESEWPYKLPNGWKWVTLNDVADYINGRAFKPDEWEETGKLIIRIQNLTNSTDVCNRTNKTFEEKYIVNKGDLLFAWSASLGAYIWHGEQGWLNQHIFKVVPNQLIDRKYLYYYLTDIVDQLYKKTHGSGMVHITLKPFKSTKIPVPSVEAQKNISSILDKEFQQLDEAKSKIEDFLKGQEESRQAILHRAFTGELTEQWRKDTNRSYTREYTELDKVCNSIYDGDHMPPPKTKSGIPFIVISNINDGKLSLENTRHVSKDYYDSLSDTRKPERGDVLYTLVGSYGIPAIVDTDKHFCFQRHMALLKPGDKIDTSFLWYMLQSDEVYRQASKIATGTAQLTVPIKGLRKMIIPLYSLDEQHEIVRILDIFFHGTEMSGKAAERTLKKIEMTKKSLLSKAFHGELKVV